MQIATTLQAKAQRLVDEDKVVHLKGLMYHVFGDSGSYAVHLSYPEEASGRCNCPSTAEVCSHILAASIYALAFPPPPPVKDDRDPFEGLGI